MLRAQTAWFTGGVARFTFGGPSKTGSSPMFARYWFYRCDFVDSQPELDTRGTGAQYLLHPRMKIVGDGPGHPGASQTESDLRTGRRRVISVNDFLQHSCSSQRVMPPTFTVHSL